MNVKRILKPFKKEFGDAAFKVGLGDKDVEGYYNGFEKRISEYFDDESGQKINWYHEI